MKRRRHILPLLALLVAGCGTSGTSSTTNPDLASAASDANPLADLSFATKDDMFGAPPPDLSTPLNSHRPFPDTSKTISILVDQLPGGMTAAQQQFVVSHFVGTQKLTLDISKPLRALKPDFLVLHYHLAIWQSAPGVSFILDGNSWSNDYPMVTQHEGWFWHNTKNQRVMSTADQKLLMNLADPDFAKYWADSYLAQIKAGDYDAVFADSASPALLQGECGGQDARIAGTGVKDTPIAEWGGKTYIQVWQTFMTNLNAALAAQGIPLIPNTGAFITTWDNSDYSLSAGFFSEGFADPGFAEADWKASTDKLILLIGGLGKIAILQNYLGSPNDLAKRRYYLANYLLVKGSKTYLDYFAQSPLEWYPEWGIDLGAPMKQGKTSADYQWSGVYRRDFEKGMVLVNPSGADVMVTLPAAMKRVEPSGGGAIGGDGMAPGTLGTTTVSAILVPAHSAEILLQ